MARTVNEIQADLRDGVDENTIKQNLDRMLGEDLQESRGEMLLRQGQAEVSSAGTKAATNQAAMKGLASAAGSLFSGFAQDKANKQKMDLMRQQAGLEPLSSAPNTKLGRVQARAEGLKSKAEIAGERGNVYRQAKLSQRAKGLESGKIPELQKRDIEREKLFKENVAKRRLRTQTKLDKSQLAKQYGSDLKKGSYKFKGDLYEGDVDESLINELLQQQGLLE
tara:strand:+ start:751 stop:1419 length:669 start_codon:yes stop_codon:yes gene_type:complete